MSAQAVGAYPIQCLDLCVTPSTAIDQTAGQIIAAGSSGAKFYTTSGSSSTAYGSGTVYGLCYDTVGNAYIAINTGSANQIIALSSTGTVLWTTTLSENVTTAIGMDVGGGYVWVGIKHGSTSRLYQLSAATGTVNTGTFVYSNGSKAPSALAVNWISYLSNVVVLAYAGGSFDAYRVLDGSHFNTTGHSASGGFVSSAADCVDVGNDGLNHFVLGWYDTATGVGSWVQMWDVAGGFEFTCGTGDTHSSFATNDILGSVCFDPIGQQILVVFTSDPNSYDLKTVSPATGQVTHTYDSTHHGLVGIRPNGLAGFVAASASAGALTIDSITLTPPTTITVSWSHATGGSEPPRFAPAYLGTGNPAAGSTNYNVRGIAVSNGTVVRFNQNGPVSITGGTYILSPGPNQILSAQMFQQLFFADGQTYRYYDAPTDSVLVLSASSGSLPGDAFGNTATGVCCWRNRLVWWGLPFDRFNWFMSAIGDFTNYNYAPTPTSESQAVAGNDAVAGLCQDIVNVIIPYSDELAIFGGSKSIFQMTGDPAQGGRLDLITDGIGIAFGKAWCRDGIGNIYFVSTRGSIYQFAPGSAPVRLSDAIAELVTGIDVTQNVVRMEWDERLFGFNVWFTPIPRSTNPALYHFFYDTRVGSWWRDTYPSLLSPFATVAFDDGNPLHRMILLGGQDGYIRKLDVNALDDDGIGINSNVYVPVQTPTGEAMLICDLQADLDSLSSPVSWAVQGARDAQTALTAPETQSSGTFSAGRNHSQPCRVFGHAAYIVLQGQDLAGSSWTLESLRARVRVLQPSKRQRIFP